MGYTTHRLSNKSSYYNIRLNRMVKYTHTIILKELNPSPLVKIQLFMVEHILKALMVSEHIYMKTIQVVSPDFECKNHCCKLEVLSRIVLLIHLMMYRSISYNLISLHQHTT